MAQQDGSAVEPGGPAAGDPGELAGGQDAAAAPYQRSHHPRVRSYDFRRPDKFSKDHLRSLETLHETFSHLAVSTLSSFLRMVVQVQVTEVQQFTYAEHIRQLSEATALHLVTLDPLPGKVLLEMDVPLVQSLIDRVMGGAGKPLRRARAITEVEVTLLQSLVGGLLTAYGEAWKSTERIAPALLDVVFNPEMLQIALPGESTAVVRLEVRMNGQAYGLTLCLPYVTLEPALAKLAAERNQGRDPAAGQDDWQLHGHMMQVAVPLTAVLGRAQIQVRDLLELEAGHILVLDTRADQPVEVLVGASSRFRGVPGLAGRRLAVRIDAAATAQEEAI